MLVTYLRSSSIGAYALCPFSYYLSYTLGLPNRPNYKTERGSIVHKALELLAHRKLAEQEGRDSFAEDELGRAFKAADVTAESAVYAAWDHYTAKNESGHDWPTSELAQCLTWVRDLCEFGGGIFDPRNRTVVCPERYFDLTIDEPWADYSYADPFTGERVKGRLAVKGSVDLITEVAPGTLELLDWKSGARKNWATGKVKELADFDKDPQLLLYFYALTRLYPEYPNVFITIYYAQDGGPFSLCFEQDVHGPRALAVLRTNFERVKHDYHPKRIATDPKLAWKCKSFCYYGKTAHPDSPAGEPICDHVHKDVVRLGVDRAMAKHGRPSAYRAYGSGGGVTNREVGAAT